MSKNFWLLYSDQIISNFAGNFGTFLISWLVYQMTGSTTAMGGLWVVTILAQMATQFVIGPYLDVLPRKRIMMYSEGMRVMVFLVVAVSQYCHQLQVWHLYGGALLMSIVMYDPAASALLPATVRQEQLMKANARVVSMVQLVRFLAFPISGTFFAVFGASISLVTTIVLFGTSIILIRCISEDRVLPSKVTWWTQFKKGVSIYQQMPILLVLGLFIAVTNFGVTATQTMYIPFVKDTLGGSSVQYGLFAGCFPLGYFAGAALVSRLKDKTQSLYFMFGALVYGGLTFVLLSITKNFYAAMLIEMSSGVVMPFWGVNSTTLYQRVVPMDIRAQVFAVRSLIARCATPIGAVYAAFVSRHGDMPFLFSSVGLFTIVVGGFGMFIGRLGYLQVQLHAYAQPSLARSQPRSNRT